MRWLILAGYLAMFVVVGRRTYIYFDKTTPGDDNGFGATIFAIFWPVMLTVLMLRFLWMHSIGRETPRQRQVRLEKEAAATLKAAKDLGLPMPKDNT